MILQMLPTGSPLPFPEILLDSSACLFSNLCINILRLPRLRLLQLLIRLPARLAPAFPITVPTAEAAT